MSFWLHEPHRSQCTVLKAQALEYSDSIACQSSTYELCVVGFAYSTNNTAAVADSNVLEQQIFVCYADE